MSDLNSNTILNGHGDTMLGLRRGPVDEKTAEQVRVHRRRAVRHVASLARDAGDCAELLAALGLTAIEGKQRA